jgi:hypothetical protein
MGEQKPPPGGKNGRNEEIIKAFDRERDVAQELNRRHTDTAKSSHWRDRQVLIERRRHPR